jgi:hypothetical protein
MGSESAANTELSCRMVRGHDFVIFLVQLRLILFRLSLLDFVLGFLHRLSRR